MRKLDIFALSRGASPSICETGYQNVGIPQIPGNDRTTFTGLVSISGASFEGKKVSKMEQTKFFPIRMIHVERGGRFRVMSTTQPNASSEYSHWVGEWVVLQVTAGKLYTEMVCTVVAESDLAIRIRIADICEVEIYKEMIVGVARAWPMLTPS